MSCCPAAPASAAIGAAFAEANGTESDMRPGESIECYMARGGNSTGLQDDATMNAENKIENSSIPLSANNTVSVSFRLTEGSTRVPTAWSIDGVLPTGIVFSNGVLSGRATSGIGQVFKIEVSARDAAGVIDARGFAFSPSAPGAGNKIRMISPLPGGIVNSKFGPRKHPITGVMKPHTGIDMKMADRSVRDVVAGADGEVVLCGGSVSSGYGLRVWVRHFTASGAHLCTSTYNHLQSIYVREGQKVMAGQKLGREGSTGASTGNHLHFEVRLPDGKFIDPLPIIAGRLSVAEKTLENGDADPASITSQSSDAALSAEDVKARQESCAPFGPNYPAASPPETDDAPPANLSDPFELAWHFTMTHEVGPHWATSPAYSPGDAELEAGLHATKPQQKKTGYVNVSNFPGGETKFGVAQKPNPRISVDTMTYQAAKRVGFNNYWKSAKLPCGNKSKMVSIMTMDMNYLHGDGNARQIYANAGFTSATTDSKATQQTHVRLLYDARVAFIKSIPRPEYHRGWLKRAKDCLDYCLSVS